MGDSFTDELWRGITDVYDAILAHPFLGGLADGSLPPDSFAFYVVQDALYLREYARALAATSMPVRILLASVPPPTASNAMVADVAFRAAMRSAVNVSDDESQT